MCILYHLHLGDDGFPLLMQPLLVGFEQDWISVAPSAMVAWVRQIIFWMMQVISILLNILLEYYNVLDW